MKKSIFSELKYDVPSSIVVFLVAMPLCLGIAMASGAPLFSGLIAGIVGGIVVGSLSGSPLGVSGPAAGLAVIVLNAISDLGSYETFLMAVVISGALQVVLGFLKGGVIAYYFPTSVINGMLAGIGITIFLKQIPHGLGYDVDPEGEMSFFQADSENTFSEVLRALENLSVGPILITLTSLAILILWETKWFKQNKVFRLIQGPLVAVILGIILNKVFGGIETLALIRDQMVNIPVAGSMSEFFGNFKTPNFSQLANPQVYITGLIIAIVGSLETLLCVEASDKQDPFRRITPTNRELKAQGIGNMVSGLIGGLPVTQVVVRSSVNVQAGGRTKLSTVVHGFLILTSIILIPNLLNQIPLATLAAILFVVGYKLAKPALFKKTFAQGYGQFIPFVTTILGILLTDLLIGICLGLTISIFFILYNNYKIPIVINEELKKEGHVYLELSEDVSFLKKASLQKVLYGIPDGREVTIDASKTYYIHQDVIDIIEDFRISAESRNIKVNLVELYDHKQQDPLLHCHVKE